jgi:hypothetical protein
MGHRSALLAAIRGRAPDEPVTVPAAWLQSVLAEPDAAVPVDLTAGRIAELLGRDPMTVAAWCRAGLFEGAYKLRGREWRVPAASLQDFQRREGRRL